MTARVTLGLSHLHNLGVESVTESSRRAPAIFPVACYLQMSLIYLTLLILLCACQRCLSSGQPRHRHPERRAAHIIQANLVTERNTLRIAPCSPQMPTSRSGFALRPCSTAMRTSCPTPSRSNVWNGLVCNGRTNLGCDLFCYGLQLSTHFLQLIHVPDQRNHDLGMHLPTECATRLLQEGDSM